VPVDQLIQSMKRPKSTQVQLAHRMVTQQQQLWTPMFLGPRAGGASSGSSTYAFGEVTGGAGGSRVRKERRSCGEPSGCKR